MTTKASPTLAPAAPAEQEPYPSTLYAWYVVGVLTLVYVFSFIDRQILNLLVAPIRKDLGISDTQMSLLMGFSFAVFYTFFGIVLGRLADSKSRRSIIAVGFVMWSLFTACCGVARNFFEMLLLRMGVGVGEAALSPAAYSLITDYFPKERRATAISVYSMGIYIGSGLAYMLGGIVIKWASAEESWDLPVVRETRPWQVIFFIVGLPGILLAMLVYTIREPVRRGIKLFKAADGRMRVVQVPLKQVFNYIFENKGTFICHNVGFALLSFSSYGSTSWVPTFLARTHGWTGAKPGLVFGAIVAIFGTLGIVAGGWLADRMAARGHRDANMRVGLIASLAWLPCGMLYPLVPSDNVAIALMIPSVFLASAPFGVAPAAIQQMMPNAMRGQASAVYLFIVNLIGLGLGPTAVALTTDYIFRDDYKVNYSLAIVATVAHLVAALLLWAGLKPFIQSLDRLKAWMAANA